MRTYAASIAYACVLALVSSEGGAFYVGIILTTLRQFATSFQVCMPGAVTAIFGPEALATNLGFILLFQIPPNLFGAAIAGVIRDGTYDWKWVITFAGLCSLAGGVFAALGEFEVKRQYRDAIKLRTPIATARLHTTKQLLAKV